MSIPEQTDPAGLLSSTWMAAEDFVKFTVEVVRGTADGPEELLYRTMVDEISPRRTKAKASQLLGSWRHRGASLARVRNQHGEELYCLRE